MRDHRIGLDLFTDVLDVLDRHGFARGDDEHAGRAIFLIGDLARIYEGTQHHPYGPSVSRCHPRPRHPNRQARKPNLGRTSPKMTWTPSRSPTLKSTVLTSLDLAADWKRDRAETCAHCPDQSCFVCHLRLKEARTYDQLAGRILHDEQAARDTRVGPDRPGRPRCPSSPAPPRRRRRRSEHPGKTPDEPGSRRQSRRPPCPSPAAAEEDRREPHDDPYDLPSPDDYENWLELQDDPYDPTWSPTTTSPGQGRPKFHIAVDQRRGWQPAGPPSLAELLENLARTREPEPDLEAEP